MNLQYIQTETQHLYRLIYADGESRKAFHQKQFRTEAIAGKITDIIWEGIYGNDIPYPVMVCSSALTEGEQTTLLGLITDHDWLDGYKADKINEISELAFVKRSLILPDYKIDNANLGVYDAPTKATYLLTVSACRTEYYRVEALIEAATDLAGVDSAVAAASYPTAIVTE